MDAHASLVATALAPDAINGLGFLGLALLWVREEL
jgi:hypothetical protein